MSEDRVVTCSNCGAQRPTELIETAEPNTPCAECGAITINIAANIGAELGFSASISKSLKPDTQQHDWRQRWEQCVRELDSLIRPHAEEFSAASVLAAGHGLYSFYIQAYHIKDALIEAAATTGISGATVEATITAEPELALLADLANLAKHGHLNKPPRSGDVPKFAEVKGESDAGGQWVLRLSIEHHGLRLDGLQIAQDAMSAWRRRLTGWGLI